VLVAVEVLNGIPAEPLVWVVLVVVEMVVEKQLQQQVQQTRVEVAAVVTRLHQAVQVL
jgi:hypothetical protein